MGYKQSTQKLPPPLSKEQTDPKRNYKMFNTPIKENVAKGFGSSDLDGKWISKTYGKIC